MSRSAPLEPGYTPLIAVRSDPIDPDELIAAVSGHDAGAVATFLGTVRSTTQGKRVLFLEYEAYAPMAEKVLREIALALPRELGPCRIAIAPRVGSLVMGRASAGSAASQP